LNATVEQRLSRAEWAVALLLTLVVLWLHYEHAVSAGGLWRDEANTLRLATLPSLHDIWNNLQYDSFPILWILVVRCVAALVGPLNDPAFRVLGSLVGVGIVGAMWLHARTVGKSVPLLSLSLLAMSPGLIEYGDSMRAYGFGILLIVVTAALMWRFVNTPAIGSFLMVLLAAIASVHTLYYNAVLVLVICVAAFSVSGLRSDWKTAALVVLTGVVAAISIIPYSNTIRGAASWNSLVRIPSYTFGYFLTKLESTLHLGGAVASAGWIAAFALALVCAIAVVIRPSIFHVARRQREVAIFELVVLLSSVAGIFVFLHTLSYLTQPWYYLSLAAIAGVSIDGLFGALVLHSPSRLARLVAVVLLATATFLPARRAARTMMTTVDIVAAAIQARERTGDFIVVDHWATGVNFSRYYRGTAEWLTIPSLPSTGLHRYDLLLGQMKAPNQETPVRAVIDGIEKALRNGQRVYVVGLLEFPAAGRHPVILPPFTGFGMGLGTGNYEKQWSSMVGYDLSRHATSYSEIRVYPPYVYNLHENVRLFVAAGWRP
jgi:hypothetical protein